LADNYDGVYARAGYPDPQKCSDFVLNHINENSLKKNDVSVLDFACGTGLVGQCLYKDGVKNLHGLDISKKMLQKADEKDVYKTLKQLDVGQKDFYGTFPPLMKQKYDFVTCAGLINNNHMDENIFEQMLLALKNGGVMVFAARFSYIGNYWYTEKLELLEKLGRIKLLDCESFFKYDNLPQSVGRFAKTPVKVYAYKKVEADSVLGYKRANSLKKEELMALLREGIQNKMREMIK